MDIIELKHAIALCHLSGIPLFVWSARGMGKSSAVRQYTDSKKHFNKYPYGFVDLRASQMEASEIRGIPKDEPENNWFRYLPPIDLPQGNFIDEHGNIFGKPGDKLPEESPYYIQDIKENSDNRKYWPLNGKVEYYQGVLFLDEPNRGEDDVLQAIFQLVLDRKAGGYTLPDGWGIVAAGNPSSSKYRVNTMVADAAFSSRWCHVSIERSESYVNGWLDYMHNRGFDEIISDKITQFCASNLDHLVPEEQSKEELDIEPNPRSWEMVAKVETVLKIKSREICDDTDIIQSIRRQIIQGLIGIDIAASYFEWSTDIYPKDVVDGSFNEISSKLEKLKRSEIQGLMWGIANYATSIKQPSNLQKNNVIRFITWMIKNQKKDLAVAFVRKLTSNELESSLKGVALVNPSIQKLLKQQGKSRFWYDSLTENSELAKELRITAWGEEIKLKQ